MEAECDIMKKMTEFKFVHQVLTKLKIQIITLENIENLNICIHFVFVL